MARIKIRTPAQLRRVARAQVGTEIRGELAPLARGRRETLTRRAAVLSDLEKLFGQTQPYVAASAQNQRALATEGMQMQKGIFDQVANRLGTLRQQQATEAQQLAQTIGGPVPVEEWTQPVSAMQGAQAELGAGQLLQSQALGQAAASNAETFAGQVFPAIRSRATTEAISEAEEDLATLLEKETEVRGSRAGRETTAYDKLLAAERQAQLAQSGLDLEALKGKRDWALARRSAGLAEKELGLERELGRGNLALQRSQLAETRRANLAGEALSREANVQKKADWRSGKEDSAWEILDALATGGEAKLVTVNTPQLISDKRAKDILRDDPDANVFKDYTTNRWYRLLPQDKQVGGGGGIPDNEAGWNDAYARLITLGTPADIAERMVRAYFGSAANWVPGKRSKATGLPKGAPTTRKGPPAPGRKVPGPFKPKKKKKKK